MDGTQSIEEKKKSLKLSKFLLAKGLSHFKITEVRQVISYDLDIDNAFSINEDLYAIKSGSFGDGVPLYYGFGRMNESSDLDLVIIFKNLPVSEIDATDNDWIIKLPDPECIGYARLWVKQRMSSCRICECVDGKYYLSSRHMVEGHRRIAQSTLKKVDVHGPALDVDLPPNEVAAILKQHQSIPTVRISHPSFNTQTSTGVDKTDQVYCVESKTWPAEADEWKSRKRLFDWPKGYLVEQIVQTGCIFAPVGSKESPNKYFQWRISFNKAESLLTRSFNETQMSCYVLLKMVNVEILKNVSRKCITSYIMKLTMFWVSESMQQEEWQPEKLMPCFLKCISRLRDWITARYMPNYFIVCRNMFLPSELTDEVVYDTLKELDRVAKDPFGELERLEMVKGFQDAPLDDMESMFMDVVWWLRMRLSMAEHYFLTGNQILYKAYDYKNVPVSIQLCETVLAKLSKLGGYTKPMCDLVQNCLAVLHYVNSMKPENADIAFREKELAMKYFEASKNVDCTHAPLRMATCLMMEKRYNDALLLIKTANNYYTKFSEISSISYQEQVEIILNKAMKDTLIPIKEERRLDELRLIHKIAENDVQLQDLEQTMLHLQHKYESIFNVFNVAWKYICFDVIFMSAEIPVLPKSVQLEAMMKDSVATLVPMLNSVSKQLHFETFILTLNPGIYACYLGFLCNLDMGSSLDVCKTCLHDLNRTITEGPVEHKPVGYNLLSHCYLQLDLHGHAAKCLVKSLLLNPDYWNIAYHHFKKIIGIFMTIDIGESNMNDKKVLEETIIYQRNK